MSRPDETATDILGDIDQMVAEVAGEFDPATEMRYTRPEPAADFSDAAVDQRIAVSRRNLKSQPGSAGVGAATESRNTEEQARAG